MLELHEKLAREFCRVVRREIPQHMSEISERNRQYRKDFPGKHVCATHDFCDANELMNEAWETVVDRGMIPCRREDAELWGNAWDTASNAGFWANSIFHRLLGLAQCCGQDPVYHPWMGNPYPEPKYAHLPRAHGPSYYCAACGKYQGIIGGDQLTAAGYWNEQFTGEHTQPDINLPGWSWAKRLDFYYRGCGYSECKVYKHVIYKISEDGKELSLMNPCSGEVSTLGGIPKSRPCCFNASGREYWDGEHKAHYLTITTYNGKWYYIAEELINNATNTEID